MWKIGRILSDFKKIKFGQCDSMFFKENKTLSAYFGVSNAQKTFFVDGKRKN